MSHPKSHWFTTLKVIVFVVLLVLVYRHCTRPNYVDVATFNIENFPKSEEQVDGAFDIVEDLGLEAVAVQEIRRPNRFESAAKRRLGDKWEFTYPRTEARHKLGVLFDGEVLALLSTTTHTGTIVHRGARPALEARFSERSSKDVLRLIVIHLKAGSRGLKLRQKQYRALRPVLTEAVNSGERTFLLGDFNSTEPKDRTLISRLAENAGLRWITRNLHCTSYWKPRTKCLGSTLDHILAPTKVETATARGPCQSVGCEPGKSCPTFYRRVSDHCPITFRVQAER